MENKSSSNSGLSLGTILTIVFVILKLCGVIDWSWWLVFLPVIIGAVLSILVLIIVVVYYKHKIKKMDKDDYFQIKHRGGKWKF